MNWNEQGGAAFPFAATDPSNVDLQSSGMSLRDWFAGQALAIAWDARDKGYYEGDDNDMASCAYKIADAMLEARNK